MAESAQKIALVAGGGGLVGRFLIDELLVAPEYSRIYAVSRRPLGRDHARLANRIVRFEQLESQLKGFVADDAYCCLGTTIAKAGSEAAFRKVDFDLVLAFARAARAAKAQRFIFVSSAGADPDSRNFYLQVKGDTEMALIGLGFGAVDIMQPGLLLGSRREMRPVEAVAQVVMPLVNPLLVGSRMQYRAVSAQAVARAMIGSARSGRRGPYRYTYTGISTLANGVARPR